VTDKSYTFFQLPLPTSVRVYGFCMAKVLTALLTNFPHTRNNKLCVKRWYQGRLGLESDVACIVAGSRLELVRPVGFDNRLSSLLSQKELYKVRSEMKRVEAQLIPRVLPYSFSLTRYGAADTFLS
jgi:hypothetical protein